MMRCVLALGEMPRRAAVSPFDSPSRIPRKLPQAPPLSALTCASIKWHSASGGGVSWPCGACVPTVARRPSDFVFSEVAALSPVEPEDVGGAKGVAVGGEHALDFVADGRVEAFV